MDFVTGFTLDDSVDNLITVSCVWSHLAEIDCRNRAYVFSSDTQCRSCKADPKDIVTAATVEATAFFGVLTRARTHAHRQRELGKQIEGALHVGARCLHVCTC